MSKKKIVKAKKMFRNTSFELRKQIRQYYVEKFFNKFLNRFEFEGLDYQQIAYIMRKMWDKNCGTLASYVVPHTESELKPQGEIIFAPYAPAGLFNIYDYPVEVNLINTRGVNFIPNTPQKIDEDICIGFIQKNRKGVETSIEMLIDKIVDLEMTIRTNLKAQKTPWLVGVSPENEERMSNLWDNLDSDDPKLFVSLEEINTAKALVSGAPYILDKLESLRQQAENEALTRLGINNIGVMEKKEHLVVDEINANNEQIASSGDEFIDCLNEWFDNISKVQGIRISVKLKETPIPEEEEDEEMEDSENE